MRKQAILLMIVLSLIATGVAWRRRRRRSCYRNCSVSGWGGWGACSTTCGSFGIQYRYRYKTLSEQCGGWCPYGLSQSQACNRRCCPRACSYYYTAWSTCSGCGTNGRQYRRAIVQISAACGGTPCPSTSYQYRTCNTGRLVIFARFYKSNFQYLNIYSCKTVT